MTSCEKRADSALWKLVHLRGFCEKCGKTFGLECHHLVRRSIKAARWVLGLAMCLCDECHRTGVEAAHAAPEAFEAWLERAYPEKFELMQEYTYRRSFEKVDAKAACKELEGQLYGVAA